MQRTDNACNCTKDCEEVVFETSLDNTMLDPKIECQSEFLERLTSTG